MLRPIQPSDTNPLVELAAGTDYFKPMEIAALREVFEDYFDMEQANGHLAYAEMEGAQALGFVYFAPVPMTEGTWSLYWIAVAKDLQNRGLGTNLLHFVEAEVRKRNGRLLLIDTSSIDKYESTRAFYSKRGYTVASHIPDYYAEGDGLVVYGKRL
jgi:ribosomal protein S18 acetylase RimI-like enzyme